MDQRGGYDPDLSLRTLRATADYAEMRHYAGDILTEGVLLNAMVRVFRRLDLHLSGGGTVPAAWASRSAHDH